MTLSKTSVRAIVGATLTAAAIGAVLASAAPAGAAAQTTGCSSWVKAPTTSYHMRECAGIVRFQGHKMIRETIYVKNLGAHTRHLSGEFMVSFGQSGNGASFTDNNMAPGATANFTRKFSIGANQSAKVAARITVDGHNSPMVHTNVSS